MKLVDQNMGLHYTSAFTYDQIFALNIFNHAIEKKGDCCDEIVKGKTYCNALSLDPPKLLFYPFTFSGIAAVT